MRLPYCGRSTCTAGGLLSLPGAAGVSAAGAAGGSFVLPQDEGETRRRLLARLDAQLDDAVATARLAGIDLSEFHERSGQRWTATNKK